MAAGGRLPLKMTLLVQLVVLVTVLAETCAKPGANDIEYPSKPSGEFKGLQTTTVSAVTTTPSPKLPVNELYPHALLFGSTCGGSIISPTWIITAAHCSISNRSRHMRKYWSFSIDHENQPESTEPSTLFTVGRHVLAGTSNSADSSGVYGNIKRLVIHPLFSVGPYWVNPDEFNIKQVAARWDFMLAELDEPLELDGKKMAAVPLDDQPLLPVGLNAGYAGYGASKHGGFMRHEMHGMELMTIADSECGKLEQFNSADMLCARGRPPRYDSACNGDSGSGLVGDGRLLGVASWVEDDARECRNGTLVVFSRISSVRSWIRNVTGI